MVCLGEVKVIVSFSVHMKYYFIKRFVKGEGMWAYD